MWGNTSIFLLLDLGTAFVANLNMLLIDILSIFFVQIAFGHYHTKFDHFLQPHIPLLSNVPKIIEENSASNGQAIWFLKFQDFKYEEKGKHMHTHTLA